jgi:hypothetical protein
MRTAFVAILLLVQAVSAAPRRAANDTGFSGTWILDPARSALQGEDPGPVQMLVAEEPSRVRVTVRLPDGGHTYTVTTDGKPSKEEYHGDLYVRTVRREKGALVFQTAFTRTADKASISYTERWSLSNGGSTLSVYRVFPGGQDDLKVFARKG